MGLRTPARRALLHLSATQAERVLQLVPDSAIGDPTTDGPTSWSATSSPTAATPTRCWCSPPRGTGRRPTPPHPRRPISIRRHHHFAVHLANLYTRTVTPSAVQQYAREVIDEAYRRAIALHGQRMQQLAESEVAREDLTDYLTAMRAHLADLWRRGEAARVPKQAS